MVRSRELSPAKRAQMEILHSQKISNRKIAAILYVSHSAVTKDLARIKELGSRKSRTRVGRPQKTSVAADRLIRRTAIAHPTWSSSTIQAEVRSPVSTRTVRRRLLVDFKLPSRRQTDPPKKSNLARKILRNVWCSVRSTETGPKKNG